MITILTIIPLSVLHMQLPGSCRTGLPFRHRLGSILESLRLSAQRRPCRMQEHHQLNTCCTAFTSCNYVIEYSQRAFPMYSLRVSTTLKFKTITVITISVLKSGFRRALTRFSARRRRKAVLWAYHENRSRLILIDHQVIWVIDVRFDVPFCLT